jgi:nucleotide-binding universal stress UspA family protein
VYIKEYRMLNSILTALDGSEQSDAVVQLGVRWANQLNAKLVGISVIDQPTMRSTTPVSETDDDVTGMQGHWKEDEQRAERCLQLFTEQCAEAGVNASAIKDVGSPAERILLEANRHDLLLLSPYFQTPTSVSNTFTEILRSTPRPIVGVPRELPSGDAIVIAYDGSPQSSRALQAFSATGLDRSKRVYVISIDDDVQEATRRSEIAVEFLHLHDIEAESRPSESTGPVAEQLLAETLTLEAGLLVLGAHKKPILQEMFLGSVTKTIMNESTVPLFLYY